MLRTNARTPMLRSVAYILVLATVLPLVPRLRDRLRDPVRAVTAAWVVAAVPDLLGAVLFADARPLVGIVRSLAGIVVYWGIGALVTFFIFKRFDIKVERRSTRAITTPANPG